MQSQNVINLLNLDKVLTRTGTGRTKHYADIKCGLIPQPIKRGDRFSRWPSHEIDEVVTARAIGMDDTAIKALVQRQMVARSSARVGAGVQR